jgi:hypothetical protein
MRRVETVIRLYWGLLVLFSTVTICAQISAFYQFHPDSVGPHNIPFLSNKLMALGYVLVPFVVVMLSAMAAFWRRPLAYAGILFFHLVLLVVPLLSLLLSVVNQTHRPRAVVVENWLNVGLLAGAMYLLTTPIVRTYFPLVQRRKAELYRYTALVSFLYAGLSFLL